MVNNVYLQFDWKSAQFYEHSAEEKIGFEPHTNTEGRVSYRRYHKDGLIATYQGGLELRDSKIGQRLQSSWQVGDTYYKVQLPMFSQSKEFTEYTESFIRHLPNLKVGTTYRMYPYYIEKSEENKYANRGISFKIGSKDGEKVPAHLVYTATAPDDIRIPKKEWEEFLGKSQVTQESIRAKVRFLGNWLQKYLAPTQEQAQPTPPQVAPQQSTAPVGEDITFPTSNTPTPTGEDDDLPF